MPELPEVETTRAGLAPHVEGRRVTDVVVRERRLRWPVPAALSRELPGQIIQRIWRRGKYLLLSTPIGSVIIHLGMSGSLRIVAAGSPVQPHEHVDLVLDHDRALRLRDPRRFGCVLWTRRDPLRHRLLAGLGPEPLGEAFDGAYLAARAAGRRQAIKGLIMDSRVVVGVGNIYATEALFRAGIHPARAAGRISAARLERLARCIRDVLASAIEAGGTTLRDFVDGNGRPGYFSQQLDVYGRAGQPCPACGTTLKSGEIGQRTSVWCPRCQR